MFADMSVEDNLLLGGWSIRNRDLAEVFDLLPDLAGMRRRKAGRLSGGQQQMVAVGRALMARPDLLAIDELSLGLAPAGGRRARRAPALPQHASAAPPSCWSSRRSRLAFDVCARACVLEAGPGRRVRAVAPSCAKSDAVRRAYFGDLAEH